MLRLVHSPSLEPLLEQLAQRLSTPLVDPFAPELVVVPSSDMARYLKRELARTLGASKGNDGIVSNISFIYPRQLVNATSVDPTGLKHSEWDANNLTWNIIDTLLTHSNIVVPGFTEAPLTVARRAADLFDRYASHRPEMLRHWSLGGIDDGTQTADQPNDVTKDQRWQKELFNEVSKKFNAADFPSRALNNLETFATALQHLPVGSALPARLSVFGITTLSRAARHILEVLSQACDIDIYMVYAAGDVWPEPSAHEVQLRSAFPATSVQHPLTSRWGAQVLENAAVFGKVERTYLPSTISRNSLLHDAQDSIITDSYQDVALTDDARKVLRASSDGSLQVHACYGLARQVEALRDAFLHELNNNPHLQLRDFAILCADIDAAAPIISAVFAPPESAGSTLPSLPINVLGNSASSRDPLIEAFIAVLHLLTSRCSPTDVLDVAHLPAVRRAFGLDDDALTLLSTWSEDLTIRYGLNASLRSQRWGINSEIGTWDAALNRLMMGIAIPGEVDRIGPGNVVPYDGIGGSDMRVAGTVSEFIARVMTYVETVSAIDGQKKPVGLTVQNFCTTLYSIIDSFLQVSYKDASSMARLHQAINTFQRDVENSLTHTNETFTVNELVAALGEYFNDERALFGNNFESITVAPLDGQQHIPYRVLAILGADERAFAGAHSDGDDVLANNPCVGEPMYSLDGRQRLLNAVMSARDTLIITCTGADISNNKETPLAVPVQELIEFIDTVLHARANNPYGTQQLVVRHPRQNFHASTLTPGLVYANTPFTFDPQAKEAHDVLHRLVAPVAPVVAATPPPSPTQAAPTLKNLVQVITNPAEFYVGTVLNARIPRMPAASSSNRDTTITGDGIANLTIDNLSWSGEGRALLEKLIASNTSNDEAIEQWETVRPFAGVLPPGELGKLIVGEIREELLDMIACLPPPLQNLSTGTDIDGAINISGVTSAIRIQNVQLGAIARVRYKRFNESLVLEPWLELAILTLITGGDRFEAHLVTRGDSSTKRPEDTSPVPNDETAKKKGPTAHKPPAHRHFVLIGDTPAERIATAQRVVLCVEGMHAAASNEAPPFFERASKELASGTQKKAEKKLTTDLEYSAAAAYAFGDLDADSIFSEEATAADYKYLGIKAPKDSEGRAELYANYVWGAFESTTTVISATGGESSEDDGEDDE
jgi:exodeoxyribonuclease V gamma subunit